MNLTALMLGSPPNLRHVAGNVAHVGFGSQANICSAQVHVRFTPEHLHCAQAGGPFGGKRTVIIWRL